MDGRTKQILDGLKNVTAISPEFDLGNATNGDLGALIAIPAGSLVTEVYILVTEAIAGVAPDLDIGDEDTIDRYAEALGALAVNISMRCNLTDTTAIYTGFYYATANTIQAKAIAIPSTSGKIKLIVKYIQLT